MDEAKAKIRAAVEEYIRLFPTEFALFKKQLADNVDKDDIFNPYQRVAGADMIERKLGEIPETLYYALRKTLTDDEWDWFQHDKGKFNGTHWFYETFPAFRTTSAI
jgi:hypothetical protein